MYNRTFKKIENYLYRYNYIDMHIEDIKSTISDSEYNQSYTKWIKNKSSSLEDQVIRNMGVEQRIYKLKKWKSLISYILQKYRNSNKQIYKFINLKYFDRANFVTIQNKLGLSLKEQKDIQAEILQYIFFLAIKNNMLKEVDF